MTNLLPKKLDVQNKNNPQNELLKPRINLRGFFIQKANYGLKHSKILLLRQLLQPLNRLKRNGMF